jgi:hypothetical protein
VAALITAGVCWASTGAAAESQPPELSLRTGPPSVTLVPGFDGSLELHLGIYVLTGSRPFEVRVQRDSYEDPVVATHLLGGRPRRLPSGLVEDFSGFPDFTRLTFTDGRGRTVFDRQESFCPNTGARRADPDSLPKTPYPAACSDNPFALGAVWGIPAGWGSPVVRPWYPDRAFDLPPGTYTATVTINPRYREAFRIAEGAGSASVQVTVPGSGPPAQDPGTTRVAGPNPGSPPETSPRRSRLPDLRPLPAWDVELAADGAELRFATTIWNAGPAPLVVEGFRRSGRNELDTYQFFYDGTGQQVGLAPSGTMEWHQAHEHWHFKDFARYRLLDANQNVVLPGTKVSFCILSTEAVDLLVPNAERDPELDTDQFLACAAEPGTALSLRQMLDVGFGDTYSNNVSGQSFDISEVPNGTYIIEIEANPDRTLDEFSTVNNISRRKLILGGEPGARTVEVPPYEGIDR